MKRPTREPRPLPRPEPQLEPRARSIYDDDYHYDYSAGYDYDVQQSMRERRSRRLVAALVMSMVLAIFVGTVGLIFSLIFTPPLKNRENLPDRIEELTQSLNSAARTISQIENEIAQRKELVSRLQKDADIAEKLAAVNKQQAEAIAQALRGEIERDQRSQFWSTQAQAIFYTILGALLSELVRFLRFRFWLPYRAGRKQLKRDSENADARWRRDRREPR